MVSSQVRSAVIDLAREAGRATMTYYGAPADAGVREKEDRSPVTLADEVAHAILVEGLRRIDPATPIVSEEAAAADFEARRGWDRLRTGGDDRDAARHHRRGGHANAGARDEVPPCDDGSGTFGAVPISVGRRFGVSHGDPLLDCRTDAFVVVAIAARDRHGPDHSPHLACRAA